MRNSCLLLAMGILNLMPLSSTAQEQEVVPYAKSEVKVDWVRGTDFSKYKTYAWGTTYQVTSDPKHPTEDIDAALQAKGLQKVAMNANPDLIAAFSGGNRLVYPIRKLLHWIGCETGHSSSTARGLATEKSRLVGHCGGHPH